MLYNQLEPPALAAFKKHDVALETKPHLLNFFLYLWSPSALGPCCPGITLPDTIVIQDGVVDEWFFTAADGSVKRKSDEKKGDKGAIYDALVAGSYSQMRRGTVALHIMPDNSAAGATVTPLDADSLGDLIAERTMRDGLLQKYTIGPGCEDVHITTQWNHGQTWVDRGVSPAYRPRNRSGAPADEHGAGVGALRPEAIPLPSASTGKNKSLLMERMSQLCEVMALHVADTSPQHYRLERMKLNFRVDSGGGIKFMFCSDVTLEEAPVDVAKRLEHQAKKRDKKRREAKIQAADSFIILNADAATEAEAAAAEAEAAAEVGEAEAAEAEAEAANGDGAAAKEEGGEGERGVGGGGGGGGDGGDGGEAEGFELPEGLPHPKVRLANSLGMRRTSRAATPGEEIYNRPRAGLHQAEVAMTSRTYGGTHAIPGVDESRRFMSSRGGEGSLASGTRMSSPGGMRASTPKVFSAATTFRGNGDGWGGSGSGYSAAGRPSTVGVAGAKRVSLHGRGLVVGAGAGAGGGGGGDDSSSRPSTSEFGTRRSLLFAATKTTTLPDLGPGPAGAARPARKGGVVGGGTGRRGGGGALMKSGSPRLVVPEPSPMLGPSGVLYQVAAGGRGSPHH
jgi:hypothetical protein